MNEKLQLDLVGTDAVWTLRDEILRVGLPRGETVYEGDERPDTLHVGAFSHAEVVAVSTICRDPSCQNVQAWRLRGMAVRPQWRNCGVGTALASYCIAYAQRSGAELVWSTARLSALTFYKRLGFLEVGDPFSRADVAEDQFIRMELRFSR